MNSYLRAEDSDPHPDLAKLCSRLEQVRGPGGLSDGRLDLRDLGQWGPQTLAVLLASILEVGDGLSDIPSVHAEGVTCLQPAALELLIRQGTSHWQEEHTGGATIGSTVFADQESIYAMLREVARYAQPRLALSSTWIASAHALGYELATNVLRHSGAKKGVGVVAVDPGQSRLSLAIADRGVGIRASLAQNPKFAMTGDLKAIIAAMGAAATGEPGKGAGMGLYLAHHVLQDNGGTFLVRSGSAYREMRDEIDNYSGDVAYLHGTLVSADIRTDRALDYGHIDKELRMPQGIRERSNG